MNKRFNVIVMALVAHNCVVNIRHLRDRIDNTRKVEGDNIAPRGGVTYIRVVIPGGQIREGAPDLSVSARATCSKNDTYCRGTGADLAFKRLLRKLTGLVGRDKVKELIEFPKDPTTVPDAIIAPVKKRRVNAASKVLDAPMSLLRFVSGK